MSGLAGVLARRTPPGVYRWQARFEPAEVRHTVEHAGWAFAGLDAWTLDTKPAVLDALATSLAFPEHFGHNLDALADCLYDVPPRDRDGQVLLWDGWSPFARADRRSFDLVLRVLADRVTEERLPPFAVLLRGDGPTIDVALLE